jgi:hypothetical protein
MLCLWAGYGRQIGYLPFFQAIAHAGHLREAGLLQADGESGALTHFTLHFDPAAVGFDNRSGDG